MLTSKFQLSIHFKTYTTHVSTLKFMSIEAITGLNYVNIEHSRSSPFWLCFCFCKKQQFVLQYSPMANFKSEYEWELYKTLWPSHCGYLFALFDIKKHIFLPLSFTAIMTHLNRTTEMKGHQILRISIIMVWMSSSLRAWASLMNRFTTNA